MEMSLTGIIVISLVFLFFAGIVYLLIKKNVFSSGSKEILKEQSILNSNNSSLEELKIQNKELTAEIFFLEEKNKKLKQKVKDLKEAIVHLEEQKKQLEKSESTLKELRIQKEETLTMVAHDIKNPAGTIKNFVNLLESYDLNAQEQQDVLKGLLETSSRILNLADEFSSIVAQEHVTVNLKKEVSNLNNAVDDIVRSNKVTAERKEISLLLKKNVDLPEVVMDKVKIKEVIDNFVNNAIKYSPANATINVSTKYDKNFATVEIKDNGFGLTENELLKAFEKGTTLSTKPTGGESSSGLGLWIAKRIVEEHDGKVWVSSKKGIGSTFAFKLPIE